MTNNLEANNNLPAKEVLRRAFNIKSVVYDDTLGILMYTKPQDLSDGRKIVEPEGTEFAGGLILRGEYRFLHHASLTALSSPSQREVLSALPPQEADRICAVRCQHEEYDPQLQRHVYKLRTYAGILPDRVKDQPVIFDSVKHFYMPPFEPGVKKPFVFDPGHVNLKQQRKIRL